MKSETRQIRIIFTIFVVGLSAMFCISLIWNISKEYTLAKDYARIEGEASYNKDLLYRRWIAMHGGVYVPVSEKTQPNKYLKFIGDRDITANETGKKLTLINPAYMTRQVFTIAKEQYGVKGHITSLRPIRPENKADEWETFALKQFEKGSSRYSSIENISGVEYMRFMHAMKVEHSCLKCHAEQGYKIGEIRGGISVSVPMDKYNDIAKSKIRNLAIAHISLYLAILLFSLLGYSKYLSSLKQRQIAQIAIIESESKLKIQNEELQKANDKTEEKEQNLIAKSHEIEEINIKLKKSNKELYEAKEKAIKMLDELNKAQALAHLGSWYLNVETNEVTWTEELYRMYGFDPSKPPPPYTEHMKLFVPESWELLSTSLATTRETGIPYDLELKTIKEDNSNGWLWAHGEAVYGQDNKIIALWGAAQDITERKKLEIDLISAKEKAENNAKRLLMTLDNMIEGCQIIGFDWRYIYINKSAEIHNQRPNTELLGNVYMAKWEGIEQTRVFKLIKSTLDERQSYQFVNEFVFPTGEHRWFYLSIQPVPEGVLILSHDITDTRLYENELKKKSSEYKALNKELRKTNKELLIAKEKAEESDRLKTEFIRNMSHEIRTPMNGILGFSEFLNKTNLSPEKRRNYINIINSCGHQLMRIIDDILEISRLSTKQVKINETKICLNDFLMKQFSIFDIKAKENKTPLYLKKGLSDVQSTILTDETKLNKILSNLLENALKFTNDGFIELGYYQKDKELVIYVKDTGIGVSKEKQGIIFERFSQEERELSKNVGGLGLGLSIAKENVELLGGSITLQSKKGEGSVFSISLPFKPIMSGDEKKKFRNDEKRDEYTILIAEDEETNYLFLETLLMEEIDRDLKIIHAVDGEKAVQICQSNINIDLVFMDLKMPIMNGLDATESIKKIRPDLIIVAQTAYTTNEDKEKAISAGCSGFITKPIDVGELYEIINKCLNKKL